MKSGIVFVLLIACKYEEMRKRIAFSDFIRKVEIIHDEFTRLTTSVHVRNRMTKTMPITTITHTAIHKE